MHQVLEEAGRLLKLVWRVSLPVGNIARDSSNNQQVNTRTAHIVYPGSPVKHLQTKSFLSCYPPNQDELLRNEIARLKSRLSQQERMLSGAIKRLRTTNQLKEGMERVIIDQCKFICFYF